VRRIEVDHDQDLHGFTSRLW